MNSRIILGTVQFGLDYGINNHFGKPDTRQVFHILEIASNSGIKILDTADAYGNASELLGEFNKYQPDLFEINTKFKANQDTISIQVAKSLERLHISSINTYFFHSFDDFINYPNLFKELRILKNNGYIKKIGVSVYGNDEFEIAMNFPELDVIQFPFNLLDNRYQRGRLMKHATLNKKELQARSVFLQGLFFKPIDELPIKLSSLKPYLKTIIELAKDYHLTLENLALLYAYSQPEIDHVIIGVDNREQLQKNLLALQQNISQEIIEEINKVAVRENDLLYPKNWQ